MGRNPNVLQFPKFKLTPPGSTIDPTFRERVPCDELSGARLRLQEVAVNDVCRLLDAYYPEVRSELSGSEFQEYVVELAISMLGRAKNGRGTIHRLAKS